ncbi:MAG: alpha/beta hydrolase [Alphaproteobacteria bacterium]
MSTPFDLAAPEQRMHLVDGLHVQEAVPPFGGAFALPVLFVHGAFHGWWAYARWLPWFASAGIRSFALSVRNHEGSRALSAEQYRKTGIEHYVEDIRAVQGWIGGPVVLVGHSLGGLMVQKAAEQGETAAVVCIGSASPAGVGATRDFEWDEDTPLLFDRDRMRRAMFADVDEATFEAIYSRLVPESTRALNQSGLAGVDVDPAKISAPMLFVGTGHDGIGLHPAEKLAAFYGAQHFTVPGTSHDVLLEDSGLRMAAHILSWLCRNVDGFENI